MSKTDYPDIFAYITAQETAFKQPITLPTGKKWNFNDHITRSVLYRDSDIVGERNEFTRVKNITRPILNLQYRTEDIDVKDVQLYVNDKAKYHLSFLVKKYHDDVFVVENDLDTFFDQLGQSRIDIGVGLSKKLSAPCPEVVPMQSIAFCDQRDILSRPLGIVHSYSPDELLDMADVGWGKPENGATVSLEEAIVLARENPLPDVSEGDLKVYEVHGKLPAKFFDPNSESMKYEPRITIAAFYQKKDSTEKSGVILYTKPELVSPFKLIKRDPIYGRAAGFGGAEELFEDQVSVNLDVIRKDMMKDSASKTILGATGPNAATLANRNKFNNMENNEIVDLGDGDLKQIDTYPRNAKIFDEDILDATAHAQTMGAANDSIMGENPNSGTPFKLQELVTSEAHGLHDYRRGQYAKHLEEIYKDWIIPHIEKKICEGTTFLSELSLSDLQYVTDALVNNEVEDAKVEYILNNGGLAMTPEEEAALKDQTTAEFKKKGNKHFIEILKGEFKGVSLGVKVNIAGKQKNLAATVDKISNIVRMVIQTGGPTALAFPGTWELINQTIEKSGLDPVDFSGLAEAFKKQAQQPQPGQNPAQPSPITPQIPQNA